MSRSNDERNDEPVPTEVYFVGGRLQRDSVSAGGFEVFMVSTLGLWLSALFIVFRSVFEMRLEDADLGLTASVSTTLAGLALAFLTLIYQLNPKDKFLKLGFSFLTFVLLLSTILVVGSFMLYEKTFEAVPRVEVWFLSSVILLAPLLGRHFAKKETWSKFERVAYLLPFLIPFPLVSAISDRKLLTGSVLLLLLGVIGLPVFIAVFVYESLRKPAQETAEEAYFRASAERWQKRLSEEKHFADLKDKVLDILRSKRESQRDLFEDKNLDTNNLLVTSEEFNSHPELPNESRALISRALDELTDKKQVYSDYTGGYSHRGRNHYLAPTPAEISDALNYFRRYSVIVFLMEEQPSSNLKALWLATELAKKFRYPRSVVAEYILEPLTIVLKEEYIKSSDRIGDISKWEIYGRRSDGGPQKASEILEIMDSTAFPARGAMPFKLQKLLSQEILPEGFSNRLSTRRHWDNFRSELNYLVRGLK